MARLTSAIRQRTAASSPVPIGKFYHRTVNQCRRFLLTLSAFVLLVTVVPIVAVADGPTAQVPVDECIDGTDNDSDTHIDYSDEGCLDDTPTTEPLTRLPSLAEFDAELSAWDAMDDRFGAKYRHSDAEYLKCKRRTRTSFRCRFGFIYRTTLYSGMIGVWEYLNVAKDEAWIDYQVKRWWKARADFARDAIEVEIKSCNAHSCKIKAVLPL